MKGTIFEPLVQLYLLKYPSRKSLPHKIIPRAQNLAISFYTHIFQNVIKLNNFNIFLGKYNRVVQSVRECYTDMFYLLGNSSQNALDFIACIICLLSQTIFSIQNMKQIPQIQVFFQKLTKENYKLNQFLYIQYVHQTLGYKVGKQSANVIFQRFIISEEFDTTNFGTKMRVQMQMKQIKQLMAKKGEIFEIKTRHKYKNKQRNTYNYEEDLKNILKENQIQIQQQNKKKKRIDKLLLKCVTEGNNQISQLIVNNQSNVVNIPSLQNKIKSKKYPKKNQQKKNYLHWYEVLKDMKISNELSHRQNLLDYKYMHVKTPRFSNFLQSFQKNKKTKLNSSQNLVKRQINNSYLQENYIVLPNIKYTRNSRMTAPTNKNKQNLNVSKTLEQKMKKKTKLKKQFQQFIKERKNKQIY